MFLSVGVVDTLNVGVLGDNRNCEVPVFLLAVVRGVTINVDPEPYRKIHVGVSIGARVVGCIFLEVWNQTSRRCFRYHSIRTGNLIVLVSVLRPRVTEVVDLERSVLEHLHARIAVEGQLIVDLLVAITAKSCRVDNPKVLILRRRADVHHGTTIFLVPGNLTGSESSVS